jgi:surfeit locus 1 family protein
MSDRRRIVFASISTLFLLGVLAWLGVWQLQRREWKENLLANIHERMTAPPVAWDTSTPPPPEFTRVTVSGDYRTDKPLLLYGRTHNEVPGIHVIASLFPHGTIPVLIDEGFLPSPQTPETAASPAAVDKSVTGIVRYPPGQGWFEPDNDPAQNQWFWIDLQAMGRSMGIDAVSPVYIELTEGETAGGPIPTGDTLMANIPNQHLNYAITWFSLAGLLAIFYAVWLVRTVMPADED